MIKQLRKDIFSLADKEKAKLLQRFFKTAEGEYGAGDVFLGLMVPVSRGLVRKYWRDLDFGEIQELLNSKIHEERFIALLVLIEKYKKAEEEEKERIFNLYLKNAKKGRVNNWDLVDLSAPNIIGNFLIKGDRKILYSLVESDLIWERRIAVLACFAFIRNKDFSDFLKIAELLLNDKQDLIHKAVGWGLREMGKRDKNSLVGFLEKHHKVMPRVMLRYSLEKFSKEERKKWM